MRTILTLRQVFWDIRPTLNIENWAIGEIGMSYAELKAVTKMIVLRELQFFTILQKSILAEKLPKNRQKGVSRVWLKGSLVTPFEGFCAILPVGHHFLSKSWTGNCP